MTVKPSPLVRKLNQRMSQTPTSPHSSYHTTTTRTSPCVPFNGQRDADLTPPDNPQQPPRSQEEDFRALDRHFATKFVQIALAQRKRAAAAASGQAAPMRPRCVVHVLRPLSPSNRSLPFRMQIYDSPHASTVTALFELPGMQNNEINVSVGRDGRLTVTGERRPPPFFNDPESGRSRYPVSEIKYGKFERTVNIPPGIEVRVLSLCRGPRARFLSCSTTTHMFRADCFVGLCTAAWSPQACFLSAPSFSRTFPL